MAFSSVVQDESELSLKSEETPVSIVPDFFLAPKTRDNIILVVEETELNVSKGTLGGVSDALAAMVFDDFKEGETGRCELKDHKLWDMVPFLCWLCHGAEDPMKEHKTYVGPASIPIAIEDIPGLLSIARLYFVQSLKEDCLTVYSAFINSLLSAHGEKKDEAMKALLPLEVLGLEEEMLDKTLDGLSKNGVTLEDIYAAGFTDAFLARRLFLKQKLFAKKTEPSPERRRNRGFRSPSPPPPRSQLTSSRYPALTKTKTATYHKK